MKILILNFVTNLLPLLVSGASYLTYQLKVKECFIKTDITRLELIYFENDAVPKTRGSACMLACFQKKAGYMNPDNTMNMTNIVDSLSYIQEYNKNLYDDWKFIYVGCKTLETKEKDECTAARKFAECAFPKINKLLLPRNSRPLVEGEAKICMEKTKATLTQIQNIKQFGLPKERSEQCMLACQLKQTGAFDKDNLINMTYFEENNKLLKKLNNILYNKKMGPLRTCKAQEKPEKDECIAAKNYAECMFPKLKREHLSVQSIKTLQECKKQSKATEVEAHIVMTSLETPKTRSHACMIACVQKKNGIMFPNNTMNVQGLKLNQIHLKIKNEYMYNKIETIIEQCSAKVGKRSDECETVQKYYECFNPKLDEILAKRRK